MTITELLAEKAELWKAANEIRERLGDGEWLKDDTAKFDGLLAQCETISAKVDRLAKLEDIEKKMGESQGRRSEPNPAHTEQRAREMAVTRTEDSDLAFRTWMLKQSGKDSLITNEMAAAAKRVGVMPEQREYTIRLPRYKLRNTSFDGMREWEQRALEESRAQSLTGSAGGYTVNPELIREFERARLWYGPMLTGNAATIIRTATGATLPFPTVNDTTNKGARLAENTQVANQDLTFSIMNLGAFKYSSKMILVSVELMQDSGISLPEFLGSALGERIGRIVNDETTVGTGTTMPWGIVTRAVASALPSGTATSFGSTTAIAYANLVNFLHSVDVAYRQNAKFMMHDLTLAKIKALTDTTGRPVWAPSFATNVPDTLFGYPYIINNSMVSTLANGVKSIVFGDLSKYYIREVRDVTILRSDDRFIDFHQSAFLAFARYDGDLLNAGTNPVMAAQHTT